MKKFLFTFNKEKAARWLNDWSKNGWVLTGRTAGCIYSFERCEPGEYTYAIDFSDRAFGVSKAYREILEDVGVDVMDAWGPWLVLRKNAADGPIELYSDPESRAEHIEKTRMFFKVCAAVEFVAMCLCILAGYELDEWWPFVFVAVAGAAAFFMVRQVVRLSEELDVTLGRSGSAAVSRGRISSLLLTAGFLCLMPRVLAPNSPGAPIASFLAGAGLGLMLVGLIAMVRTK